jgi:hypothetical protein
VEGSHRIYEVLRLKEGFHDLPLDLKAGFLDILYLILRRSVYDVIRFSQWNFIASSKSESKENAATPQLQVSSPAAKKEGLMKSLIALLPSDSNKLQPSTESIPIYKRIIRLLGVVGAAGLSVEDVSLYLQLLRYPSALTNALLQAFHIMLKNDVNVLKAYPLYLFSFGGHGAGMVSTNLVSPFNREIHFFTWFRIESFDSISSSPSVMKSKSKSTQHIFKLVTATDKSIDLFVEERYIAVSVSYGSGGAEPSYARIDQQLRRGVWYHIALRHAKPPRLSLFARDEISIHLDHVLVFQESFRFPTIANESCDITCGKNLDGQMGPVYILNESIAQSAVESIARFDATKLADSCKDFNRALNFNTAMDLLPSISTTDKKSHPFAAKIFIAYHPGRCVNGLALDVHQNCHGRIGKNSAVWIINSVKDALASLGGIPILLPLLPRLFVENEQKRQEVMAMTPSIGLGTSLGDIADSEDMVPLIDAGSLESLENDLQDLMVEGSLCLFFSILACCLLGDRLYQRQMNTVNGFDMLEYALRCVSSQVLYGEGETCVLALLNLRSSCSENPELDENILYHLLSNLDIWSKASYKLQSSLMSVLLASIKAQPSYFAQIVGVQGLIDSILANYMEPEEQPLPAPSRTSISVADVPQDSKILPAEVEGMDLSKHGKLQLSLPQPTNLDLCEDKSSPDMPAQSSSPPASVLLSVPSPIASLTRRPSLNNYKSISSSSFKIALNKELFGDLEEESLDHDSHPNQDIPRPLLSPISESSDSNASSIIDSFSLKAASLDEIIGSSESMVGSYGSKGTRSPRFLAEVAVGVGAADMKANEEPKVESPIEKEDLNLIELLTKSQRKHIRSCLQAMIVTLILNNPSEKDIRPVLDFMASCKNSEILYEMSELLLCLLVEGGPAVVTALTSAAKGPEEFASFIIFHLIHQAAEDVRCLGIRLLTHFYVRLDLVPTAILGLSLRRKGSILSRTIDSLSLNLSSAGDCQSIHRLVACGGLALLIQIITSHSRTSSEQTYSALLEMLLTKTASKSQVKIKYTDLFQSSSTAANILNLPQSPSISQTNKQMTSSSASAAPTLLHSFSSSPGVIPTSTGSLSPHRLVSLANNSYDKGYHCHRSVVFTAHYLSPDQVHDEGTNMINIEVLPIYFEALPNIPVKLHDQIYNDLLALLKHSSGNRDAISQSPNWHACIFDMVVQLIASAPHVSHRVGIDSQENVVSTKNFVSILESWSSSYGAIGVTKSPLSRVRSFPQVDRLSSLASESSESIKSASPDNFSSRSADADLDQNLLDTTFSIGMKVFATLLVHCLDRKGGWKEVEATISHSVENDRRCCATEAILSHLISELTFTIRSKYRDLHRLAKSSNFNEYAEGMDKLENLLSVILISSQFSLFNVRSVVEGVPNLDIAKMRVRYFNSVSESWSSPVMKVRSESSGGSASPPRIMSHPSTESFRLTPTAEIIAPDASSENGQDQPAKEPTTPLDVAEEMTLNHLGFGPITYSSIDKSDGNDKLDNENVFDFHHVWYDIAHNLNNSFSPVPSSAENSRESTPIPQSFPSSDLSVKRGSSRKHELSFARDKYLHPLERGHNHLKGKLILVLQTLRFFDSIFWPHANAPMRNIMMLKFQSDKQTNATSSNQPSTSSGSKRPASTNGTMSPSNESAPTLTLYSATMRMSLYILTNLSPLTDLATLNIQRIKALVDVVDRIPSATTPTQDWILASLFHATINLQRVITALEPLFSYVGVKPARLIIPIVGVRDNGFEHAEWKRFNEDEAALETALQNSEICATLLSIFDNPAGKQLIAFIKQSLALFVTIFDTKRMFLSRTMEDRAIYWYEVLVDKLKSDFSFTDFIPMNTATTSTLHNASDIFAVPKEKSKLSLLRKQNPTFNVTMTEESLDTKARSQSSVDPLIGTNSSQSDKLRASDLRRNRTMSAESTSETASETSERIDGLGSVSGGSFRIPFTSSAANNTSNLNETGSQNDENQILPRDVVTILAWLREPYFHCNLLRSIGIAKSITALEHHEDLCQESFRQDLESLQQTLREQRDQESKVLEEMMELKEVSTLVSSMLRTRENNRIRSKRTIDGLRLKQVASSWQECIHDFEADWSPWYHQECGEQCIPGRAYYELTRLKDTRMRRMILSRLPESLDHSDAAYMEAKMRDQHAYEQRLSLDQSTDRESTNISSAGLTNLDNTSFLKPEMYKMLTSTKMSIGTWDDEEDEDDARNKSEDEQDNTSSASVSSPPRTIDDNNNGSGNNRNSTSALGPGNIAGVIGGAASLVMNPFFGNANVERPIWTQAFRWDADERIQVIMDATQIQLQHVIRGSLLLTNKHLYFHPKEQTGGLGVVSGTLYDQRYFLDRLVEAYGRRYLLQSCAIELFFLDTLEVFFAFKTLAEVKHFYRILRRQHVPLLSTARTLNPRHLCQQSPWTDLWRKRLISNYEYLMRLNIIGGRSYNDITQYPVFPWVLADYTSSSIDLNDPASYRNLSLPVGALNPTRLQEFLDRYNSFGEDEEVPRFMYGSHYSSAGVVLHYLIRQEPFTSMAINLQGGRFDCPDRVFFDLQRCWSGCNSSMSDVKELIPEFFCCPEMFLNTNKLNLGELQEGGDVDHVRLPPWAKDSFDFVRIHREALESDYVSDNLHNWIDLIFGYKQTGAAAVEAKNVFYYLTYENAINIDAIADPLQREATKTQVIHFGQTPSQLFTKEHPKRLPKRDCLNGLCECLSSDDTLQLKSIQLYTPAKQYVFLSTEALGAVISIQCIGDRFVAVHANLTIAYYRWNTFPDGEGVPFQLRPDRRKMHPAEPMSCAIEILQKRSSSSLESTLSSAPSSQHSVDSGFGEETASNANNVNPNPSTNTSSSVFSMFSSSASSSRKLSTSSKQNSLPRTSSFSSKKIDAPSVETKRSELLVTSSSRGAVLVDKISGSQIAITLDEASFGRIVSCGYWDHALKVHSLDALKEVGSANSAHMGQITCVQLGYQGGMTIISGGDDGTCRVWILENPTLALSYAEKRCKELDLDPALAAEATLQCVRVLWGHTSRITDLSYSSELDVVLSSSASGLLCLHTVRQGTYLRSIDATLGHDICKVLVSSSGYLLAYSRSHSQLHLFWINGQQLAVKDLSSR